MLEIIQEDVSSKADIIAKQSIAPIIFDDRNTAQQLLSSLSNSPGFISAALYDSNRLIFSSFGDSKWILDSPLSQGFYEVGSNLTVFRHIILSDGNLLGSVSITVELSKVDRIANKNAIHTGMVFLVFIGEALFVVLLIQFFIINPITKIWDAMEVVSRDGDYSLRINNRLNNNDEIGQLIHRFNNMLSNIEHREEERKRYLIEREKIVQDLHDGLGSIATNIGLIANILLNRTADPATRSSLSLIASLADEALLEIRGFMYSLDDQNFDWHIIAAEMKRYGSTLMESHDMRFLMEQSISDNTLKPTSLLGINLYRIYKESLNNVVKHSNATRVIVCLEVGLSHLSLFVEDDGVGLNKVENKRRGFINMRDRAREIGGTLEISDHNGGVTVHLVLDLDNR